MRIAIGAIAHESSSFTPVATPYEAFSVTGRGLLRGDEIIDVHRGVNSGAGGFIAGAEEFDFELAPVLWTFAEPSAPVEADAWRRLKSEFLERLANVAPVDGVLLDLHGAMVIEDIEDGEGDLLSGIREVIGDDPPVIATLDLHGNISQRMCDTTTALIPCDNYPHTDFLERGLEASAMIVGTLRGELAPVMAWRQLPMLWTGGQFTGREPFDSIVARAHALETQPGILTASVAPGFPWADIHDAGASIIVVADRDAALARREADALGGWIYAQRDQFLPDLDSWDDALRTARAVNRWPAVFGDPQDNPGGGAPGDSVGMLRAFLDAGLTNALIVTLCDPEVVGIAQQAGEGAEITVDVGGKVGSRTRDRPCAPPRWSSACWISNSRSRVRCIRAWCRTSGRRRCCASAASTSRWRRSACRYSIWRDRACSASSPSACHGSASSPPTTFAAPTNPSRAACIGSRSRRSTASTRGSTTTRACAGRSGRWTTSRSRSAPWRAFRRRW